MLAQADRAGQWTPAGPPGAPAWFTPSLLMTVIASAAAWYALVAVAMSTGAMARAYRRAERGISLVTGAVFVGVGVRLAAERPS